MAHDNRLWEKTWANRKRNKFKIRGHSGNGKVRIIKQGRPTGRLSPQGFASKAYWVQMNREFLRWKKTDDYRIWRKWQFGKQAGVCYYCDEPLINRKTNIEHIIPRIRGGTNHKSNLVLSCWKCNKDKNTDLLSPEVQRDLKEKHQSKTEAYKIETQLGYELYEHLRED